MDISPFFSTSTETEYTKLIRNFFNDTRTSIRENGLISTKLAENDTPSNTFSASTGSNGLRKSVIQQGIIQVAVENPEDFDIVVKHPNLFTAIIGTLARQFDYFACIRNPLSVLASWNTLDLPLNDGHAPAAEKVDPMLKIRLSSLCDRHDRQVSLLNWYFEKYKSHLEPDRIIKYEDVISTNGDILNRITRLHSDDSPTLNSRNTNNLYNKSLMEELASRLLSTGGAFLEFYNENDIQGVMDQF